MKTKYLLFAIFILFLSSISNAFDDIGVKLIYSPDNMAPGVGISLGSKDNEDSIGFVTYPINKGGLHRYLEQDAGYFNSGQAYLIEYEKRMDVTNRGNIYYCLGYSFGGVCFEGKNFDEFHPALLGNVGMGIRKETFKGEIYIEGRIRAGIITYEKVLGDLLLGKLRPEFAYEFPIYLGYRMNL